MAATFTAKNGDTTVKFEFTAPTAKLKKVCNDAAHGLWSENTVDDVVTNPFADATEQEKLDTLDAYVKSKILAKAKVYSSNVAYDAAMTGAKADAETDYDLG